MDSILWEEPPQEARRNRGDRLAILAAVRQQPGQWARLGAWSNKATAQQAASDVRCGRAMRVSDSGAFESRWAEISPGVWGVWVRWVPAEFGTSPI